MLNHVFAELGFNDIQKSSVKELLSLTGCLENININAFETPLQALDWLKETTQKLWLRKPGSERWDQTDSPTQLAQRAQFLKLFDDLKLLSEIKPTRKVYYHVLLLGALETRVKLRLDYLKQLWELGIRFKAIYLLGGQRSLVAGQEDNAIQHLGKEATEIQMMEYVANEVKKNWPQAMQEVKVISVDTPMQIGADQEPRRPVTEDTIEVYYDVAQEDLKTQTSEVAILVISNQPYVAYQHAIVRKVLPNDFIIETVGDKVGIKEKISVILDSLARQIYANYPRLQKQLMNQHQNLQSFKFKSNENLELVTVENTQLTSVLLSKINTNNQPFDSNNNAAIGSNVIFQPLFQSLKTISAQQPLIKDRDMRIAVVGEQRQIEEVIAKDANPKKTVAVFVVPTLLTPLYISPEDVEFNADKQLFALKTGYQIPDGLIPEAKLNDPEQLSTVLGRVLSVSRMLQTGIKILILHQEEKRPKADKKEGVVDETQLQSVFKKYPHLIETIQIKNIPKDVCAANYCYHSYDGADHAVGIDASQVIATTDNWGVRYDKSKLNNLNQLLNENGLKSIEELSELDDIHLAKKSGLQFNFA